MKDLALAAPGAAALPATEPVDTETLVEACAWTLLAPRTSSATPPLLESIMGRMKPSGTLQSVQPDAVLTDLFGVEPRYLPGIGNNFCAELGNLTEAITTTVFRMTRPNVVDRSAELFAALYAAYEADPLYSRSGKRKALEWKNPDFLFGHDQLVETKYRFNSSEARDKQANAGRIYRKLGYQPVLLQINPDCPGAQRFRNQGWEVHAGEDMLAFVEKHTGINLRHLLRRVAMRPDVTARLDYQKACLNDSWGTHISSSLCYAPEAVRDIAIDLIIDNDDVRTLYDRRRQQRLSAEEMQETKRKAVEICDRNVADLGETDALVAEFLDSVGRENAEAFTDALTARISLPA